MYLFNPKRKLEFALEQQNYYFYDDPNNVRKNFLLVYKGVMFEGEKYSDDTTGLSDVASILISSQQATDLKGFVHEDFHYIKQMINEQYPNADIDWKSPIKELLYSVK